MPIMLMRNLDPIHGHCNGARYYIKNLKPNMIHAVLAVGPHKGEEIFIPRIKFLPEDKTLPFEFERKQFPVRICFPITGNKSQGQSLAYVGIYLKNDFFSHGQLYVAMSRVGASSNLTIYRPDKASTMSNIVFKQVLTKQPLT